MNKRKMRYVSAGLAVLFSTQCFGVNATKYGESIAKDIAETVGMIVAGAVVPIGLAGYAIKTLLTAPNNQQQPQEQPVEDPFTPQTSDSDSSRTESESEDPLNRPPLPFIPKRLSQLPHRGKGDFGIGAIYRDRISLVCSDIVAWQSLATSHAVGEQFQGAKSFAEVDTDALKIMLSWLENVGDGIHRSDYYDSLRTGRCPLMLSGQARKNSLELEDNGLRRKDNDRINAQLRQDIEAELERREKEARRIVCWGGLEKLGKLYPDENMDGPVAHHVKPLDDSVVDLYHKKLIAESFIRSVQKIKPLQETSNEEKRYLHYMLPGGCDYMNSFWRQDLSLFKRKPKIPPAYNSKIDEIPMGLFIDTAKDAELIRRDIGKIKLPERTVCRLLNIEGYLAFTGQSFEAFQKGETNSATNGVHNWDMDKIVNYINEQTPVYNAASFTSTSHYFDEIVAGADNRVDSAIVEHRKDSTKSVSPIVVMKIKIPGGKISGKDFDKTSFRCFDSNREVLLSPYQKIKCTHAEIFSNTSEPIKSKLNNADNIILVECEAIPRVKKQLIKNPLAQVPVNQGSNSNQIVQRDEPQETEQPGSITLNEIPAYKTATDITAEYENMRQEAGQESDNFPNWLQMEQEADNDPVTSPPELLIEPNLHSQVRDTGFPQIAAPQSSHQGMGDSRCLNAFKSLVAALTACTTLCNPRAAYWGSAVSNSFVNAENFADIDTCVLIMTKKYLQCSGGSDRFKNIYAFTKCYELQRKKYVIPQYYVEQISKCSGEPGLLNDKSFKAIYKKLIQNIDSELQHREKEARRMGGLGCPSEMAQLYRNEASPKVLPSYTKALDDSVLDLYHKKLLGHRISKNEEDRCLYHNNDTHGNGNLINSFLRQELSLCNKKAATPSYMGIGNASIDLLVSTAKNAELLQKDLKRTTLPKQEIYQSLGLKDFLAFTGQSADLNLQQVVDLVNDHNLVYKTSSFTMTSVRRELLLNGANQRIAKGLEEKKEINPIVLMKIKIPDNVVHGKDLKDTSFTRKGTNKGVLLCPRQKIKCTHAEIYSNTQNPTKFKLDENMVEINHADNIIFVECETIE